MAKKKENLQLVKADISPLQQFGLSANKDDLINLVFEEGVRLRALTIKDIHDTQAYKAVKEGIATIKQSRVAFTKSVNENILNPAKKWIKDTQKDLDEINSGMSDIEQHLRDKMDAIDKEKQRLKNEEAKAKALKIQMRIAELTNLGGTFNGNHYEFACYPNGCTYHFVESATDVVFDEYKNRIEGEYTIHQQMLLEERLKREQEEADALALQNKLLAKEQELKELEARLAEREKALPVIEPNIDTIVDQQIQEHVEGGDVRVVTIGIDDVNWDNCKEMYTMSSDDIKEHFGSSDKKIAQFAKEYSEGITIDEHYANEQINQSDSLISVPVTFDFLNPYIDIPTGKKSFVRVYAPFYREQARNGIEEKNILEQGVFYDELLYVSVKK